MHRLSTWLRVLDSYASFSLHKKILTDVIAAKQSLGLDVSAELREAQEVELWHFAFVYDERFIGETIKIRQEPNGAFYVGPLRSPHGAHNFAGFWQLRHAFDRFLSVIHRNVEEPYRVGWHPFGGGPCTDVQVGKALVNPSDEQKERWDNATGMRLCLVYDWSDGLQFYYDEVRCAAA